MSNSVDSNTTTSNLYPITFGLRIGTTLGVVGKLLCAQTYRELNQLSVGLIKHTHHAIKEVRTITFRKLFDCCLDASSHHLSLFTTTNTASFCGETECVLQLTYKEGLKVNETASGRTLADIPFAKLKNIIDGGGGGGADQEQNITLEYSPNSKVSSWSSIGFDVANQHLSLPDRSEDAAQHETFHLYLAHLAQHTLLRAQDWLKWNFIYFDN